MFPKFSKFRSKGGSQTVSPPRNNHHDDGDDDRNLYHSPKYGKAPQLSSPQATRIPPTAHPQDLGHRRTNSLLPAAGKRDDMKPSLKLPVLAPLDTNYDSEDTDGNVSYAESLFPVTPSSGAVQRERRLSESSWSSDGRAEGVHEMSRRESWEYKRDSVESSRRTSWDVVSKRSDRVGTTMNDWTSSSLPEEEEINSGPPVLPSYDDAEEDFLEEFEEYFNHLHVDHVRRDQYPNLELQKLVYLDYASFALFSNSQVRQHLEILLVEGPCLGSAAVVSEAENPLFVHVTDTQERLVQMLNTSSRHYSVIFTAGFQESFRLVAESFPFQRGSPLLVCQDNHAAVRPVIRSALQAGGKAILAPVTEKELCFHSHDLHKLLRRHAGRSNTFGGLFVYPAQSNLSGVKHSLSWVVEAQQSGWNVCVDATTLLPTNALDLEVHQPDFIVGSFHHMVGYPSGMGFLLVRRESFCVRPSPSGTMALLRNQPAEAGADCHIMCPADNSMNLLQFAALNLGLLQLERIGLVAMQKRTRALVQWLLKQLRNLRHNDDESRHLVRVYGSHSMKDRGSIVSFNLVDFSGTVLPPEIVKKMAARSNIKLAVGNFNNPGLANLLGAPAHERSNVDVGMLEKNWSFMAVRASFGAVSSFSDVYRLVQFLSRFRDEEFLASEAMEFVEERNQLER